ncbi:MAG: ABC transporter ATP-binding protein [Deltaproteobacteria bacterium]|nr:ABC transporter ATP-binding protein [Deltaproteobacteria bacterium]
MNTALELINVSKYFRHQWTFRPIRAVQNLSFGVSAGEVYGIIGHNGAGKTTTFKMLMGLLRPTSGKILWKGKELKAPKERFEMGFSPEQPYFYDHLTVRETLDYYGQLYGMQRVPRRQRVLELAERFSLTPKLGAPMRTLSKGNLQRVAVAQAIMHRPKLAVLDEPMSGLDPAGRKDMRDLIASLRNDGTTVLFSSHVLSDAEALCDRVAIFAEGQLREVVDLDDRTTAPIGYNLVVLGADGTLLETLQRLSGSRPAGGPQRWSVLLHDQASVRIALQALEACDVTVEALQPVRPSLEQHFLQHTNGAHRE